MSFLSNRLATLRLTPFDVSTPEGRASERYRLAMLSSLANLASRGGSMLLMILSVSLTVPYLGASRFGAWAVFSSLVAMLSFLDLGVGNALINRVAHASADGRPAELRRVVGGGVAMLGLIGTLATIVLLVAAEFVPWNRVMRLEDPAALAEVSAAAQVFALLFGLNLLSSGCLKVLNGQQRSYEAHLLSLGGVAVACVCIWFAAQHRASIPVLLAAGFGAQSLVGLLALPLLWRRGQFATSGLGQAFRVERSPLLQVGGVFLVLQIGTMVVWGSDNLLLAAVRGTTDVAALAIGQRLFQFASQPVVVVNGPLWAAYADAHARGDRVFMRRTLKRSFLLSLAIGGGVSLLLIGLAPWIVPRWTQGAITLPMELLLVMAVWTLIESGGTAFGTYLNGAGLVREQVLVVIALCLVAVPLKLMGAQHFGATGLVCGTIAAYVLTVVLLYATVLRRRVLLPLADPKP